MEWLEQNIDAYRIIAEILGELREAVRQGLERTHGDKWYRKGLPEKVLERLVAAKEREQAIDWYESQYQQVMDYAVFPDLLEIIEHNADSFQGIMGLAPSSALLNARFLELEVMRAKLGRTRPISESELSFLGTFHLRFRKAMADARTGEVAVEKPPSRAAESPEGPGEVEIADIADDRDDEEETPHAAVDAADGSPPPAVEESAPRPPRRPVRTSEGNVPAAAEEEPANGADEEPEAADGPPKAEEGVEEPVAEGGRKKLSEALEEGDQMAILRDLYREVTAIAEGMWTSDVTPAPLVWEQVTASDWYELNFSRLGLQPLSNFYDVIDKVDKKVSAGAAKDELQEYLKEANFAKILLSLRDMFQKNNT